MTKLELINEVIEIQENRSKGLDNTSKTPIGVCFSFYLISLRNYVYWGNLAQKEFEKLFNDTDTAFWLTNPTLSSKQNNLNRLTCLYLFREMIKGEAE